MSPAAFLARPRDLVQNAHVFGLPERRRRQAAARSSSIDSNTATRARSRSSLLGEAAGQHGDRLDAGVRAPPRSPRSCRRPSPPGRRRLARARRRTRSGAGLVCSTSPASSRRRPARARRAGRGSARPRRAWPSWRRTTRGRRRLRSSISSRAPSQRLDLVDQRHVERLLGRADVVALRAPRPRRRSSAATSWSPPMPMWRWMRQIGTRWPCWRNARYHAIACW